MWPFKSKPAPEPEPAPEPVEVPPLDEPRPVTMVVSVSGGYIAGCTYTLPAELADPLILKGYAVGVLSRDYTDAERSKTHLWPAQSVVMG